MRSARRADRMTGSGRRPIVRWAVRMFRRELRQQLVVLLLLTVAVGAAVAGVIVAVTVTSTADSAGELGSKAIEGALHHGDQETDQVPRPRRNCERAASHHARCGQASDSDDSDPVVLSPRVTPLS